MATRTLGNGASIDIPDSDGAYILSTGCGSGKTTLFKDIIRNHHSEGILYAVDSRKECRSMYTYLINDAKLNPSDVMMLYTSEGVKDPYRLDVEQNLLSYKQDPAILLGKKIVIITHSRLFSDLPDHLLVYNPKITKLPPFDGDFTKLMARDDLRKHILIDETPQFYHPMSEIPGWMPIMMSDKDGNGGYVSKGIGEMETIYGKYIKGRCYDPFDDSTKLGKLERESSMMILSRNIQDWLKTPKDSYPIQFLPKDLSQNGMKTRLLIAEGCGDLLFGGQGRFQLIDVKNKYRSKLQIIRFTFALKRNSEPPEKEKFLFLQSLKSKIENEPQGTLIVVWKDFKGDESGDMTDSNQSRWRDEVRDSLLKMGVPESRFAVTYYGASDTKSTNDYRDFGSIICCGKWFLPASSAARLNEGYGSCCQKGDYNLYQYCQLVCRISLRKNDGSDCRMYCSEDFYGPNGEFPLGKRLLEYINNNYYTPEITKREMTEAKIRGVTKSKQILARIVKLIENGWLSDDDIIQGNNVNKSIPLADIHKLIPYKKRRRDNYDYLISTLGKLGVNLTIV